MNLIDPSSQLTLEEVKNVSHRPSDLIEACVYDFDYEDEDCQLLKNQGGQEMFMLTSPPTLCYTFNYHYKVKFGNFSETRVELS